MSAVDARAYACRDEERREALRNDSTLMGIDFLEVSDDQRELSVFFVDSEDEDKVVVPEGLSPQNVEITGGTRITKIRVTDLERRDDRLIITVTDDEESAGGVGDFSPYVLKLVGVENLDPLFSSVAFSFKVGCPAEFDCEPERASRTEILSEPELDYMAKDYASFRRLLLDRLSILIPGWEERSPADLQITLVELLAYVGDYLSYEQDAVATEAYLGTAKRRVSVRRHARLVDYFMHDGCNARAWAQVQVQRTGIELPKGTRLLTRTDRPPGTLSPDSLLAEVNAGAEVFETMHKATLHDVHNELRFYTWGDRECCLPKGATGATLLKRLDALRAGDVLILEEALGPRTGLPEDADPEHRHAVRLTRVSPDLEDPLFEDPDTGEEPVLVTEVEWRQEDALPFSLCISAKTDEEHGSEYVDNVSVARGNVVLADHGMTLVEDEDLGAVPDVDPIPRSRNAARPGEDEPEPVFPRFRPLLGRGPLTQAAPYVEKHGSNGEERFAPATSARRWDLRDALPQIELDDGEGAGPWCPRRDLLGSGPSNRDFVAEVEADGRARLRFGDDTFGLRPARGTAFTARYRVGNGVRGNVGADAIAYVVTEDGAVLSARNPLPAWGGVEPETIEEVRQSAPSAFRVQKRAVTPEDYAEVAQRHPEVQRAAATIRWTGSWHTVFLTIDRFGGRPVDAGFEEELSAHLERYRLAGHDLEVDGPRYVSLEVDMLVCVLPEYFRSDVNAVLLEELGNRTLPDERRGVFHPDNLTFGQPVFLSRLYEAAQAVEGVDRVEITKFQRQGLDDARPLDEGVLPMYRLEIARLDNDPNFPENGVLRLTMEGGK